MPRQFEKYRFRDGVTPLSEETFNRVLQDIDLRISALEGVNADWEAAADQIANQGLARVDTSLTPLLADLTAQIAILAAAVEAAQQAGALLNAPDVIEDVHIGNRTVDPGEAPSGNTSTLTTLLSWITNRLSAIMGEDWKEAPNATLASIASSLSSLSGHVARTDNPHQTTAGQIGTLPLAGGTLSGNLNLNGHNLSGAKMFGHAAEFDCGPAGSGITIWLDDGNHQVVGVSQSCTLTISTVNALPGYTRLRIVTTSNNTIIITWAGIDSTRWLGAASAPGIRYGAVGRETLVEFFYDGTNITQRLTKLGA